MRQLDVRSSWTIATIDARGRRRRRARRSSTAASAAGRSRTGRRRTSATSRAPPSSAPRSRSRSASSARARSSAVAPYQPSVDAAQDEHAIGRRELGRRVLHGRASLSDRRFDILKRRSSCCTVAPRTRDPRHRVENAFGRHPIVPRATEPPGPADAAGVETGGFMKGKTVIRWAAAVTVTAVLAARAGFVDRRAARLGRVHAADRRRRAVHGRIRGLRACLREVRRARGAAGEDRAQAGRRQRHQDPDRARGRRARRPRVASTPHAS